MYVILWHCARKRGRKVEVVDGEKGKNLKTDGTIRGKWNEQIKMKEKWQINIWLSNNKATNHYNLYAFFVSKKSCMHFHFHEHVFIAQNKIDPKTTVMQIHVQVQTGAWKLPVFIIYSVSIVMYIEIVCCCWTFSEEVSSSWRYHHFCHLKPPQQREKN